MVMSQFCKAHIIMSVISYKDVSVMATGIVKWFNPNKSFGFIKPDDGASDVFVHISALQAAGLHTLDDNQKIEYDLENSKGKTSAVNLKLL